MRLLEWVQREGALKWSRASQLIPGRSGKQCRERWLNNLNPDIKKSNWTDDEDELIFALYKKYGSAWSKIAKHFEGRTENSIKNRFYSTIRRLALDRTRQSTGDSTSIIANAVQEKSKKKETNVPNNGELQSILQELTQNYKNAEKKEEEIPEKDPIKDHFIVKKEEEPKKSSSSTVSLEGSIETNLLKGFLNLESNINQWKLELPEKEQKELSIGNENLNEIFKGVLLEEEENDKKIIFLIKQLKSFECSLMAKTKESLDREIVLMGKIEDQHYKRKLSGLAEVEMLKKIHKN